MARFTTDTAVEPLGEGHYRARLDEGWWAGLGPNGGYVGAVLVHALEDAVGDPARVCRSFTVHYLARPDAGAADVEVVVERVGRSLTSASARLSQGGRPLAIAVAALSTPRPGPEFCDLTMPDVPGPEELDGGGPGLQFPAGAVPVLMERYEQRWAVGPRPFSGSEHALSGGWIRLAEPAPVDAAVVVALTDAWMPALYSRVSGPFGITTVDLTVHLRDLPTAGYDDWCLVVFRSKVAADGFCEEDGEVWTRDGRLVAQSRQLVAFVGLPRP